MTRAQRILLWAVAPLAFCVVAAGQRVERDPPGSARSITVSITRDGARFAALGAVAETRLEVIGPNGVPVYNSGFLPGNVRDWHPQADSTQYAADGEYVCFVTARAIDGAVTMKQGRLVVLSGQLALELGNAEDVGGLGRDSGAPAEERLAATVEGEGAAMIVTAHDGATGQVTATSGDLTLRTGDFFVGKDEERLRVTAEGRVGIGTSKPEAALDVAGTIRAKGGVQFSDGTTLDSSDGRLSVKTADGETSGPTSVTGTGTQDRLVKWAETGGAGTLTDSVVRESSGRIGIGVTPAQALHVFGRSLFQNTGTASLFILDRTDGKIAAMGAAGASSTLAYDNSGIFKIESNSRANIASGVFGAANGATSRLVVDGAGNVGVGNDVPGAKLDVAGTINTATQYNIAGARVLSTDALSNVFLGASSGTSNTTGSSNTFLGTTAGSDNTTGGMNTFVGAMAGRSNTTGAFNAFFGWGAGYSNTSEGGFNTFVGSEAGYNNTVGSFNAVVGWRAGFLNESASHNSFFGNQAGRDTTNGPNSFFGYLAGSITSSGDGNSFFGFSAGGVNTTGSMNSYYGHEAGFSNTAGQGNAAFGYHAGYVYQSGNFNTLVGHYADGFSGVGNTILGAFARVGVASLTNASAIGSMAMVTTSDTMVLGSVNGVNSATSDTNVAIGSTAATARLQVTGGDIAVVTQGRGLILRSTNSQDCVLIRANASLQLDLSFVVCP
jgi:hypothetical protein